MSGCKFPIPKGFQIPEGVSEGSTFDAFSTIRLLPKGMLQLVEVDGSPVPSDKSDSKQSYGSTVKSKVVEDDGEMPA